jgi:zinc transporter ZupT
MNLTGALMGFTAGVILSAFFHSAFSARISLLRFHPYSQHT